MRPPFGGGFGAPRRTSVLARPLSAVALYRIQSVARARTGRAGTHGLRRGSPTATVFRPHPVARASGPCLQRQEGRRRSLPSIEATPPPGRALRGLRPQPNQLAQRRRGAEIMQPPINADADPVIPAEAGIHLLGTDNPQLTTDHSATEDTEPAEEDSKNRQLTTVLNPQSPVPYCLRLLTSNIKLHT